MTKIHITDNELNVRRCVNGIIPEYLDYTEGHESPSDFHLWCIISAIGTALGRNVYLDRFFTKVYPNLYIILIGESAIVRKSTAISMAASPLRQAIPELVIVSDKITPAKLASILSESYEKTKVGEAVIHASELSTLLGKTKLDDSLLKVLTNYWDCPELSDCSTIARGTELVRNVCLNLLGGSTIPWLQNSLPMESLEGGFLSRLILVFREPTGIKNPFPEDLATPSRYRQKENIIHDLNYIRQNLAGPYEWDSEAKRLFSNWYINHNSPETAASFMRGYYGRKGDMIIKLAIINAASKGDDKILTKEDIFFGISILNENEKFVEEVIKQLGTTEDGRKYKSVLEKIQSSKVLVVRGNKEVLVTGIEHSVLMRSLGHQFNGRDLAEVISSLISAEEILVECMGRKKVYVVARDKVNPGGTNEE